MDTLSETHLPITSSKEWIKAEDIINKSTGKVSTLCAVPIPILDIAGMTFIHISMVKKLAALHDLDSENENTLLISSFVASIVSKLASEIIEQLSISAGIHKILGESLIKASVAGFLTKLSGEMYQNHFSNGGTLNDISLNTVSEYFILHLQSDRYTIESLVNKLMDSVFKKIDIA